MVSVAKKAVDISQYEEFRMSDMLLIVVFAQLSIENKKAFQLMEKMFHRLDPLLRAWNSQGAQVVLDTFLDGYEIDREGDCDTIPEWLKEFIRIASKKIRDLDYYIASDGQYTFSSLVKTWIRVGHIVDPNFSKEDSSKK